MEREQMVYISAMQDSLKKKYGLLEKILAWTEKQKDLLSGQDLDIGAFEEILDAKEALIRQVLELDQGFQRIYVKIKNDLEENKQEYKPRILEMQNLIRQNTDLGVRIQAIEQGNKRKFEELAARKRQEIQGFRLNNRTTDMYAKHLANQHQEGQSYFLDKKK
ncbi:MAG: hypothetical protein IJ733_20320 [Lachnospiraceae bacterium]|nr:hypothetical protein [Lachnospiraceae bacterium]